MKHLLLMMTTGLLLLISCNGDNTTDFITGTYVRQIDQQFARGTDTIVITPVSAEGNSYTLIKKSAYQRIKDGALQQKVTYETKRMAAVYNSDQRVLEVSRTGQRISFDPKQQTMLFVTSEYRKVR